MLDWNPFSATPQFFDRTGRTSMWPVDLITARPKRAICEDAILSVLQYGAIIPPLAPWEEVYRCLPGIEFEFGKPEKTNGFYASSKDHTARELSLGQLIESVIDKILVEKLEGQNDPVLLFSGGVDSGFLASRLLHLGFKDTLLVNYSFGEDDPESKVAENMSLELGLPFLRVMPDGGLNDVLENPGKVYPQPFGDHSTVPSSLMANAIVKKFKDEKRVILDGTGADGAFGLGQKIKSWERVYQIPKIFRSIVSSFYEQSGWEGLKNIERVGRIARRSVLLPKLSAVLAQNALVGIAYDDKASNRLAELLQKWITRWLGSASARMIVAGDLALTCANVFAQKSKPIFENSGHAVIFPFLETEVVSVALENIEVLSLAEPKWFLKDSLSRHVTSDLIFRPKSGFTDPKSQVFYDTVFLDYFAASIDQSSPIGHLTVRDSMRKVVDLLYREKRLPAQLYNLVWAIVFTDRWYRTVS